MSERYRVDFEIDLPVSATEEQVEEWVRFCIGDTSSMMCDNPLSLHDMEGCCVNVEAVR
jgi:hypothetical protein